VSSTVPTSVFLGKGGVGKTTCAAATGLACAEAGEPSLVISTDPTPSLSHIFELPGPKRQTEVLPGLFLTELGLEEVRAMWDERFGREVYAVFSAFVDIPYDRFVSFMTSVLPGLNEEFMVDQIRRLAAEGTYRHIMWDTAPLGQTLALLEMPALLAEHLRTAPRIYSHLRGSGERRESVMAVLRRWEELATAGTTFLRERVTFSMVTIAEALAVRQLDGAFAELERHGLRVDRLIVNNVVMTTDSDFLRRKAEQQRPQLEALRQRFASLSIVEIPLFPYEIRGRERLREIAAVLRRP
jgi:arsenite/tail-anchored protein-transporting ATPase